jgi:hypothetical protein
VPDTSSAHSEAEQQLRIGSAAPDDQVPAHQQMLPEAVRSAIPPYLIAPLDQVHAVLEFEDAPPLGALLLIRTTSSSYELRELPSSKLNTSVYGCRCRMWHHLHLMPTAQSSTARLAGWRLPVWGRESLPLALPLSRSQITQLQARHVKQGRGNERHRLGQMCHPQRAQ